MDINGLSIAYPGISLKSPWKSMNYMWISIEDPEGEERRVVEDSTLFENCAVISGKCQGKLDELWG